MELRFCEINDEYIKYLNSLDRRVPLPKKEDQSNNQKYIDVNNEEEKYKKLLLRERSIILKRKKEIYKNSKTIYYHKLNYGENSGLAKRCCDFKALEIGAQKWADGEAGGGKVLAASASTT